MHVPQNKTELLEAIESTFKKLINEFEGVDESFFYQPLMPGHKKDTEISLHNLTAYLCGWMDLVLKWNKAFENGSKPVFPDEGFKWTELGELAIKFYRDYEPLSIEALLKKLKSNYALVCKLIDSRSNKEIYEVLWYKHYSMGRMIQLNTSSPFKNARTRIRKWKKTNQIA